MRRHIVWAGAACASLLVLAGSPAEAQPANDDFANAEVIVGVPGSVIGSNVGATSEVGEPRHAGLAGGASIWYRWTAPSSCLIVFDTLGSDYDTVLAVYTGTNVDSLTLVASNDDTIGLLSRVVFPTVAGTEYRIAVDGFGAIGTPAIGNVALNWDAPPAPPDGNDSFGNPVTLSGDSGTIAGTIAGACDSAGEPRYHGVGNFTVWYTWTAPFSGPVTFDTMRRSSEAVVTVYTGTALNNLRPVPPNNTPVSSYIRFNAGANITYRIAVSGEPNGLFLGDFDLTWTPQFVSGGSPSAGQFRFSAPTYIASEYESFNAPFGPPNPNAALLQRSAPGAVVAVSRIGGFAGRALVDYRTMDEVATKLNATIILSVTNVLSDTNMTSFTNQGRLTIYYTNVYGLTTNAFFTNVFLTNWVSDTNFCDMATECATTNTVFNCGPGFLIRYGCPGSDYSPVTGTLAFDEFETTKRFLVPVSSDAAGPLSRNGDKQVRLELFNPRLAPEELANPTGILPPTREFPNSQATLNIREVFPFNGGTNFSIERVSYAVNEGTTSSNIVIDIIHPAAVGGSFNVIVEGSDDEPRYFPSIGSDYATETMQIFTPDPLFTDGTTNRATAQDFMAFTTNVTINAGQRRTRITIPIFNDNEVEFNEDIHVRLEGINQQPPIGPITEAFITILDDDQPTGALDRDWNPDNVSYTTPRFNLTPGADSLVRGAAIQADQRTVIVGDFTAYNAEPCGYIARINTNGSYDISFSPGSGADAFIASVAVYPLRGTANDRKIVIGGGFTAFDGQGRYGVARLNANGSLDTSFNVGTGVSRAGGLEQATVWSVAVQSDGKVLIAGDFTEFNGVPRNGIARLNGNGSLDATFNPGSGADDIVWSVAVRDAQQNIFVPRAAEGTELEDVNEIETGANQGVITVDYDFLTIIDNIRVYYDGNRIFDLTTNGIGQLMIPFGPGASTKVTIILNEGTGEPGTLWRYTANISVPVVERKIFIGGEFLYYNGGFRGRIARLNDNGSLDLNYEPGGGADGPVYAVLPQPDGRLLVGGSFATFDFQRRGNIARLENSGALDLSYNSGTGADDAIYTLALQPDGKALVGGVFTSFNQTRRLGVTRLFLNGTVDTSFMDTAYNHFAGLINTFHFQPANFVNAIAVQADGAVMIGGSFTTVGGNYALNVTDLTPWVLPFDNAAAGVLTHVFGWQRADKHPRYNVARLIGGHTPGPGNMEFVLSRNNVNENAGSLSVPFRRLDGRLGTVTAIASTSDDLATNGADFFGGSAVVSWLEDWFIDEPISVGYVLERFVTVPIFDDQSIEGDELFGLALRNPIGSITLGGEIIPVGAALGRSVSEGNIIEDDRNFGTLAFGAATFFTNENANLRVTIIRTNGSSGQVTVRYFTSAGTNVPNAVAGQDYAPIALGTLTFGPNVTSQTIVITNLNDNFVEPDEYFSITLTNASPGSTLIGGAPSISITARIIDNDLSSGHPSLEPSLFSYATNESAGFARVTLLRLGGSQGQLSVNLAATGGTATEGVDFTPITNVVTWVNLDVAPKTVLVPLNSDLSVEGNETVNLRLFNPSISTATGGMNTATLIIEDDDFFGELSFSQVFYDADERGTNIFVTVVRSGGVGDNVTAQYYVVDGTAVNGRDFTNAPTSLSPGTLFFGPGVMATNFSITLIDNFLMDSNHTATLVLSGFGPASAHIDPTNATLRIFDDETIGEPAGSLDTTFNPGAGGTNAIHTVVLQPDGKLLVGGEFRTLNRVLRNRVGRLNPDGTLDATFDALGGPNSVVRAMALQADGRVVIGGFFDKVHGTNRNHIARLLQDGTLDRFFNPGAGADNPVYALAIHTDRRIVVGGSFTTINGISRAGIALLDTNGVVSPAFAPGAGANGTVFAVAVQPDGKVLIGGDFTDVNGVSRPHIARLNLDGSVDVTFDPGTGPSAPVRAITLQPDGRILIGGSFTNVNGTDRGRMARLDANGALDSVFLGGIEGANADVTSIAIQFDGNIIVAGEFTAFNGVSRNRITRLYRNGKTDPTINFGDGANDIINTAVIQPDRKIVIGGRFTAYDGESRFFLARIHGGSIAGAGSFRFSSPSYDVGENAGTALITVQRRDGLTGDVTVDYQTVSDSATAGADYTSVSGTFTFLEGENRQTFVVPIINDFVGEPSETVVLELANATGGAVLGTIPSATLTIINDDSGVGFGSATYVVNEGVAGGAVMISVIRTGATNGTATVNYTTANGSAIAGQDYTGQSGVLTFLPGVEVQTLNVAIVDDGLIESSEAFGISLSNLTGSTALNIASTTVTIVDNDFQAGEFSFSAPSYSVTESGGSVTISILRTNGTTGAVAVNYATVAGTALAGNDYVGQAGTLVFAEGQSIQTISISILDDAAVEGDEAFFVQLSNPTGGTIISGTTNATVTILDEEFGPGSVDRTFDPGAGANGLVHSVALQSDGRVIAGGAFTQFDGVGRNFVARMEGNGELDVTFNPGMGANAFVSSVASAAGGKVLIAGAFDSVDGAAFNRVARLNSNGAPDLVFNAASGLNAAVNTMITQPDGRVLLGGAFSLPTRGINRRQVNGAVDSSFNPGSGADGAVQALFVQPDGSILLGGAFTSVAGEPHSRVARVDASGLLDTAFGTGAITNGSVFALALQADGKVIVGGDFATAAGANRVKVARLNTDGSLDAGFNVGLGANATVYALGIQSTGQIILGGDFTTINGITRNRFARLNTDGTVDASFDPGRGANNTVYSIAVLANDNILIGGNFSEVGGVTRSGVARVLGGAVAPAGFASFSAAGGQFHLTLSVQPGRTYVLEVSSNLIDWASVVTHTPLTQTWQFTDTAMAVASAKFYRVREIAQ